MVAKGEPDNAILANAAAWTLQGYTVDQTHDELQVFIDGARARGFDKGRQQRPEPSSTPPGDGARSRRLLYRASEITAKDADWLIDGMIPQCSLGFVVAKSNTFKSFFACSIAASVALGSTFFGRQTRRSGKVVITAGEGHMGIRDRLDAACRCAGHHIDDADIYVSDRAVTFEIDDEINRLFSEIAELEAEGQVSLVIIDTMARAMDGLDENSAKDMGSFIKKCDELKNQFGCTVLVVHHTGHEGKHGRGSSARYAAADFEIVLDRADMQVTAKWEKMKDAAPPEDLVLEAVPFQIDASMKSTLVLQQVTISASAKYKPKLTGNNKHTMDSFREALAAQPIGAVSIAHRGVTLEQWRPFFHRRHPGDNPSTKNTQFARGRKYLTDNDYLRVDNDVYTFGDMSDT
jgi:hypothetical protein